MIEHDCPVCGAGFPPDDPRQVYCTERCRNRAHLRMYRGLPIHDAAQRPPGRPCRWPLLAGYTRRGRK